MAALPNLDREALSRLSGCTEQRQPSSMAELMEEIISAVNARGMCAKEVARVAGLPTSEIRDMAARCCCVACWKARAN